MLESALRAIKDNEEYRLAVIFVYDILVRQRRFGKVIITGQGGKICDYRCDENNKPKDLRERYGGKQECL